MVIDVREKEEIVDEIVFGDGERECQAMLLLVGRGTTFSIVDHHNNVADFVEMKDVGNLILALKEAQRRWAK